MAAITTLVPDIRAEIPWVPSFVAERYLIRAARVFCEETRAWRMDFLLSVVANVGTVSLVTKLPTNTELVDVISIKNVGGGEPVKPRTFKWLDQNLSDWRSDTALNANYYLLDGNNTLRFVPTPSTTVASLYDVRVAVKPTRSASNFDDVLLNKFDNDLINGALGMLYAVPQKSWSDKSLASYYTVQFMDSIPTARAYAAEEFQTGTPRKVKYGGL